MSRIVSIEFVLDDTEFKKCIKAESARVISERLILEIKNIPSISKASELIFQDWLKSEIFSQQNFVAIILKISEEIDEKFNETPQVFAFNFRDSILFSFQSTLGERGNKTFWKIPGREGIYSLFIDDDGETEEISSYCLQILAEEISEGKSGILKQFTNKNKIRLNEIGDSDGKNLLDQAVSRNQLNVIRKLLQHEFNADKAIDQAWKNYKEFFIDDHKKQTANEIILCLLYANSKLPSQFDYNDASKEVKEFVDMCENLHQNVENNDFSALKIKLDHHPNLCHYYNRQKQSLLAHALKVQKYEILDLLDKGISTGCEENLEDVYENMAKKDCRQLRGKHRENAREFPELHLFALRQKSKIGNNDQFAHKHWKLIEEAFETLNKNKYCSKILKISALCKKLKIFFDFKHDCTYYMDPATSYYSKGIIYESGPISIGAKYLTDDEKKFEVFGVLAHELCHLAVYLAFMNRNFDPFPTGESEIKQRYIDQVMAECKEWEDSEWIVANVFRSYREKLQYSEMIVTVPQMLMHYHENQEKLVELEETFTELFKYSKEIVESELDKALPKLKLLEDGDESIKFEDLTEPMKAKILHSKVIFQGEETSFFEVIGNDTEIFNLLTPSIIRDILIKNQSLSISKICKLDLKYEITERMFYDNKIHEKFKEKSIRDQYYSRNESSALSAGRPLEQVRTDYKNSKVFILADHAGTGKTTTLKYFATKLKKENKNFWFSFINLRKHDEIFEKNIKEMDHLDIERVLEILVQIVARNSEIEEFFFKKLFADGKVVLIFDGVDEICPKYSEIITKIFEIIHTSSNKNELWISTRPHYGVKLKKIFVVPVFRFVPFYLEEIKNLVLKVLEQKGKNSYEEKMKYLAKCMAAFQSTEFQSSNILMLVMIVELCIAELINFNSSSRYGILDAMVKMQKEKLGVKIPNEDRDPIGQLNIWTVAQIFALLLLIGDDYEENLGFKLSQLSIIKLWNKEKENWTSDMIQRYGFLNVDLNDELKRSSIDFMHRTYAEFFVAKYLVEFIFDDNETVRDEEIKRKYKLFELIMTERLDEHHIIRSFITEYLFVEAHVKKQSFHREIKNIILTSIEQIHKKLDKELKKRASNSIFVQAALHFESYAAIVHSDIEMTKELWRVNRQENIFHQMVRNCFQSTRNLRETTKLAEHSFGPNWHERFNTSGVKLIADEDIERLKEKNYGQNLWPNSVQWTIDKNVLKLCDLIDKSFEPIEKQKFYLNMFILCEVNSENICKLIFLRMRKVIDKISYLTIIFSRPNYTTISNSMLLFIQDQVEKILDNDKESIRKLLFEDLCSELSPLACAIGSNNPNTFHITLDFFKKYKRSNKELKNVLSCCDPQCYFVAICSDFYLEFKKLIQETFGRNPRKVREKIENFFTENHSFGCPEDRLGNYEDFINYIFNNNEKKILEYFEKTFIFKTEVLIPEGLLKFQ